jgi:hypothetical protein
MNARQKTGSGKVAVNILLAVLAPLVFLALLEVMLYFAGIKPLYLTEDSFVGFSSSQPLFLEQKNADGQIIMVTNPVKLPRFNRQAFPRVKAPGTYRIFSVGGSTAYGHPWKTPFPSADGCANCFPKPTRAKSGR